MSIEVEVDGKTTTRDVVDVIKNRIYRVAGQAAKDAADLQIMLTEAVVENAYAGGVFPQVTMTYAMYMIKSGRSGLSPSQYGAAGPRGGWTNQEAIKTAAYDWLASHSGMVVTGELLWGLHTVDVEQSDDTIWSAAVSSAPYSKDIEEGMLWGQARSNPRPFFSRHYGITLEMLKERFFELLKDEGDNQ